VDLICGINPVVEALGAESRHFDRLLIAKGVRNRRIEEAISRASRQGIALRFESRETLDEFCDAMIRIAREAEESPETVLQAPVTTRVSRLDQTRAAREPNLRWTRPEKPRS